MVMTKNTKNTKTDPFTWLEKKAASGPHWPPPARS